MNCNKARDQKPRFLRGFCRAFYPEDERFLVERDLSSTHYEVDTHVQPADPGV